MGAQPFALESSSPASDAQSVPFPSEWVTLTQQAHIELVMQIHFFQAMHERAVAHAAWREARYQSVLRQMKAQGELREAALQVQLQEARSAHPGSAAAPVWQQSRTPPQRRAGSALRGARPSRPGGLRRSGTAKAVKRPR